MSGQPKLTLHGYWRSSASYRVRIALGLKGLAFETASHDLRAGDHNLPEYLRISPQGFVPALETPDGVLTQSLAIIEWLDESFPEPPLLPADPDGRAVVRAMAMIIACDIHPLANLRVLQTIESEFGAGTEAKKAWSRRWIESGFAALERMVAQYGDGYCYGDRPGMVECLLVPQLYNARRLETDLSPYPLLLAAEAAALELEAFAEAAPEQQPDAD